MSLKLVERIRNLNVIQLGILVALVPSMLIIWKLQNTFLVPLILVPIVLAGLYYWQQLSENWKTLYVAVLVAVILVFGAVIALTVRRNIVAPSEWDFVGFWIHGRTAVQGQNFYDPQYANQIAQNLTITDDFRAEIVNVGFWYPPPSILLFLPLGFFNLQTASLIWNLIQILVLAVCIILLWQTFLKSTGWLGCLVVTCLMLMFQPTLGTFLYAQTNFFALLWLILFWRDRDNSRSGIWLAFGILTKPFLAVLILYLLLRKRWRTLASFAITLLVLCVITIALFGINTFFSYVTSSPMSRMPDFIYTEAGNQSLLAVILRTTQYDFSTRSPFTNPIFLVFAFVLIGFTAWLIYRLEDKDSDWGILLALLLSFIVYPTIGNHYLVLLMIPFLVVWSNLQKFTRKPWEMIFFIDLCYALLTYVVGLFTFLGIILIWFALVWVVGWFSKQKFSSVDLLTKKA